MTDSQIRRVDESKHKVSVELLKAHGPAPGSSEVHSTPLRACLGSVSAAADYHRPPGCSRKPRPWYSIGQDRVVLLMVSRATALPVQSSMDSVGFAILQVVYPSSQ
jgi:hypothetical protein